MSPLSPAFTQHALAVYAEPLVVRRRVVVFGDDETVAERLVDLGAREVMTIRPGDDDDLRPSSFDLALVLDLGLFDDAEAVVALARRLVGETGAALVAAGNRDVAPASGPRAFDYYELFDLVARQFGTVRMIAQLPFHGVALAELGSEDESPAVSVDTQLAGEQRVPEAFLALGSERGAEIDPYAIVELPAPEPVAVDTEELEATRAELARTSLRAQAMEGQVEQLAGHLTRAAEVERELGVERRNVAALSTELEALRSATEAGAIAAAQVEHLSRRAERAERALADVQPELARLAEGQAVEHARLEETLKERAQAVRTLETEVARRDRMVRDLVGALEESKGERPGDPGLENGPRTLDETPVADRAASDAALEENTRLRERLDALALDLARREGEAQAAAWAIAELERRLAQAASGSPRAPETDAQGGLSAALDELDALRLALTQEHELRVRAEAALKRPAEVDPPQA